MSSFSQIITATIAESASVTGAIPVGEYSRGSFLLPSAVTGTAWSFEVSFDGTTFVAPKDSAGSAVGAITTGANTCAALPATLFSFRWARIKSNGTEAAARTIKVHLSGD